MQEHLIIDLEAEKKEIYSTPKCLSITFVKTAP